MPYLVCQKCNGYYKLKEDEKPEDFELCQCGGKLRYKEKLNINPAKSNATQTGINNRFKEQNTGGKIKDYRTGMAVVNDGKLITHKVFIKDFKSGDHVVLIHKDDVLDILENEDLFIELSNILLKYVDKTKSQEKIKQTLERSKFYTSKIQNEMEEGSQT